MIATGARNLITDVPGLLVGNAQDHEIRSGVSVVTAAAPFVASVHVMGGAPGTRETDLLAPDKSVSQIDALVLSGGSAFGLDACSGVMQALFNQGRGLAVGAARVPIVPGAILFDLLNGGLKGWPENPYRALGADAFHAAAETFELGSHGAGTGAMAAMTKGGLGSASVVLADGTTVGALVAANPVGSVTTPDDAHFWAASFEQNREFGGHGPCPDAGLGWPGPSRKSAAMAGGAAQGANTTIAIVATDAPLTKAECHRVSVAAHDGIGRAIVPAHTPHDGDIVFALATGTHAGPADVNAIGHAASLCLARAIARGVYHATARPGDLLPTWHDLNPGNG
jgi:L-aminopeptidase/D-esterase-like protein